MGEEQQDSAADGDPVAAGTLLGTLRSVGLVGPRLAVQLGEERHLAKQLAERAGLTLEPWMMALVKSQIDAALESLEMEVRPSGGSKTPGHEDILKPRRVEATLKAAKNFEDFRRNRPFKFLRLHSGPNDLRLSNLKQLATGWRRSY